MEQNQPLWKERRFIIIYLAQLVSGIGDGISKIALLWLSYQISKSATTMGIIFICLTLPGIFSGFISGALGDRCAKRKIIVTAQVVQGIIAAGYVLAYLWQSIFLVYLLTFMMGAAFSFDGGPFRAYLPEIFPEDKLSRVNAAVSSVQSLTMLIGPAVGGVILAMGNVTLAFLIDAATFFISAVMMRLLPAALPRMVEGSIKIRVIFQDVKLGLSYIFHSPLHRFLMVFFVSLFGIYCLAGGLVTPLCEIELAASNDIKGSTALAVIQAVFGLGGLISSFFIPVFMRKFGYLRTLIIGAFLCVVELFAFGYLSGIYVLAVIITFTAASGPMLTVPLFTFLQEKTAPRFMGRAMGALDTLLLAVVSLSYGLGGVLADVLGNITIVFIITGFAVLLFTLLIPFLPGYKTVRDMEEERMGEEIMTKYE